MVSNSVNLKNQNSRLAVGKAKKDNQFILQNPANVEELVPTVTVHV